MQLEVCDMMGELRYGVCRTRLSLWGLSEGEAQLFTAQPLTAHPETSAGVGGDGGAGGSARTITFAVVFDTSPLHRPGVLEIRLRSARNLHIYTQVRLRGPGRGGAQPVLARVQQGQAREEGPPRRRGGSACRGRR